MKSQRLTKFFLAFVFITPLLISILLYSNRITFGKPSNHGQLLNPVLPLESLQLRSPQGIPLMQFSNHRWLILLVNGKECTQDCEKKLSDLQQIRRATGKDMARIQPFVMTPSNIKSNVDNLLHTKYKEVQRLTAPTNQFSAGEILIADPLGNVMMQYSPQANPNDIYHDLRRLLRASHIG